MQVARLPGATRSLAGIAAARFPRYQRSLPRLTMRFRRRIKLWVPLAALSLVSGCGGGPAPGATSPDALHQGTISPDSLSDEEFAQRVQALLLDGRIAADRISPLVAVVQHQLGRADAHFARGERDVGLDVVTGALLLVRSGEFRPEMVEGRHGTLHTAAGVVAKLGDEGRARALYRLALEALPEGRERQAAQEHLQALDQWQQNTREPGTMQEATAHQLAAAKRALLERTPEVVKDAHAAITDWVSRSFEMGPEQPPRSFEEQDELFAGRQAQWSGAMTMAALYLRDGDASAALAALETDPIAQVAPERLVDRLRAATQGSADAWADLFGFFEARVASEEPFFDSDLARGAAWGAALGLYRAEPGQMRAAIPMATLLVEHGMADVMPSVVAGAIGESASQKEVAWAMRLIYRALLVLERRHDLVLARRVFDNAAGVLEVARRTGAKGEEAGPTADDLFYLMGAMESRAGQLDRARQLLVKALGSQAATDALRLLASIDWQRGQTEAALQSIGRILERATADGDVLAQARAHLFAYDVSSSAARHSEAGSHLEQALHLVLAARQQPGSTTFAAESERMFAEVLERYGDLAGARRASERALEAASNDLGQLTATLLDASRRALTHGDLTSGRLTLREALEADLKDIDLVYAALWQRLLELRVGATSDGAVEEALASIVKPGGWVGALRDWGKDDLSDEQLLERATTPVERVEAQFYVTLRRHFREPTERTREKLREVARSEAIELMEVRIARDLLNEGQGAPVQLPAGIVIP